LLKQYAAAVATSREGQRPLRLGREDLCCHVGRALGFRESCSYFARGWAAGLRLAARRRCSYVPDVMGAP